MVNVGLVGVGGFGQVLLKYITQLQTEKRLRLAAVCDINLEPWLPTLGAEGFPNLHAHTSYDEFLAQETGLDAVILATPLPLHAEMGAAALGAGYNVLLEKPPAVTMPDMERLLSAEATSGKICAVGFQHTSTTSFLALQKDILVGRLGDVRTVIGSGLWKRTYKYFSRTPWAGRLYYNGHAVLDGTVNNSFSHLLMNCLLLAGLQNGGNNVPETVRAELYHANAIESEDTSSLEALLSNGVRVLFHTSICAEEDTVPYIVVEGDKGSARWDYEGRVTWWDAGGNIVSSEVTPCDNRYEHLRNFVEYLEGKAGKLSCPLELTYAFTLVGGLAFASTKETRAIPSEYYEKRDGEGRVIDALHHPDDLVCIKDIAAILTRAVEQKKLFSELGVPWATASEKVVNTHRNGPTSFSKGAITQ